MIATTNGRPNGVDNPPGPVTLLLSEPDAARAMGISPRTLFDLRVTGKVRYVRIGTAVRYSVEELKTWIDRNLITHEGPTDGVPE